MEKNETKRVVLCMFHHPKTEEGKARVRKNLENACRIGDSVGIILALGQFGDCGHDGCPNHKSEKEKRDD
jgi:hypothetical protein